VRDDEQRPGRTRWGSTTLLRIPATCARITQVLDEGCGLLQGGEVTASTRGAGSSYRQRTPTHAVLVHGDDGARIDIGLKARQDDL
jgi:hypothetical protein